MKIEQTAWKFNSGWEPTEPGELGAQAQLVFVFGVQPEFQEAIDTLSQVYSQAIVVGCSTAGEIFKNEIRDQTLSVVAVAFDKTEIKLSKERIADSKESYRVGSELANGLDKEGLTHVFVLSDGLNINGSELTRGLAASLSSNITVTGGLAGDGDKFNETFLLVEGLIESKMAVAIGFYGKHLKIGYGSLGGWDVFGMDKMITRSEGNVLFELNGESALEVYQKYLGEMAHKLPSSGLLFPLEVWTEQSSTPIVRTILGVNWDTKSMIFAGDVPQGSKARLMKANFSRLVEGAMGAAEHCVAMSGNEPELALLISCVGRKLILKQRTEEELEAVQDVLGHKTILTGFYSYGELCPTVSSSNAAGALKGSCELHNQTMTITTFREV